MYYDHITAHRNNVTKVNIQRDKISKQYPAENTVYIAKYHSNKKNHLIPVPRSTLHHAVVVDVLEKHSPVPMPRARPSSYAQSTAQL